MQARCEENWGCRPARSKFAVANRLPSGPKTEHWLPVHIDFPYEVSDQGRVRRTKTACGTRAGRILKPLPVARNYRKVVLCWNGRKQNWQIHRLVGFAFMPDTVKEEVHHKDTVKHHNALANLVWVTKKQNQTEMVKCGHAGNGGKRKLTADQIAEIHDLLNQGIKQRIIAAKFGVTDGNISHIHCGRTWATK